MSLVLRSALATGAAWTAVLVCNYVVEFVPIGRWIVAISGVALISLSFSGRLVLSYGLQRVPVNLVVLGDEQVAESIRFSAKKKPYPPMNILAEAPMVCDVPLKFSPGTNDYSNLIASQNQIHWIVVQGSCEGAVLEKLLPLFQTGTRICDVSTFFEHFFQKVPVTIIDTNWLIQANVSLGMLANRALKRAVDIAGASVGLLLTLPMLPAIALAIKLAGKGPVFYTQNRVGRNGRPFEIRKFRTMVVDAESSGKAVWATCKDSRVTGVGRFLRKTRLDEIPQFINVLLGEMSLVGPRPERPEFVKMLDEKVPHYRLRHLVRPGLTGWAQISYRYGASVDDTVEKLRYDLYYVKYGGFLLDLQIMIRTLGVLMRGAR